MIQGKMQVKNLFTILNTELKIFSSGKLVRKVTVPIRSEGGMTIGGPTLDIIFITIGSSILNVQTSQISAVLDPGTSLLAVKGLNVKNGYTQSLDRKVILGE